MANRHRSGQSGFTLIEVLIALAIISIALLAAIRAASQGTTNVNDLRSKLFAGWVAENLMAEHRAKRDWIPLGIRRGTMRQGGIDFSWREEITPTPHAAFRRIDVWVFEAPEESRSMARLTGFIVQSQDTAR